MSRAGILLAGILAIAAIGVVAQDTSHRSVTPPITTTQAATTAQAVQPNSGNIAPATTQDKRSSVAAQNSAAAHSSNSQTDANSAASNDLDTNRQLPQTSTILPLLGLIGLGSLVAGLFARR